jgi:hypothetical protein
MNEASEFVSARTIDNPVRLEPGAGIGGGVVPRVESRSLFGSRNVVTIRHAEQDYTLRITRNGKLILTK